MNNRMRDCDDDGETAGMEDDDDGDDMYMQ